MNRTFLFTILIINLVFVGYLLADEIPASVWETLTDTQYACIADGMEAYNSDIFYDLSHQEIDKMLRVPGAIGCDIAPEIAISCGVH